MNLLNGVIKIGGFTIKGLTLAPMAGYTDVAFRTLALDYGAGLTTTEMVSVRGLVRDNEATKKLLRLGKNESPSCVQLFGSTPNDFFIASKKLSCDIIDINMGCPMPKITKNGDGAALLNHPKRAGDIVRAVIDGGGKPVTVKTRIGKMAGDMLCVRLIDEVAKAGASAVTLHGRTAAARYGGKSDVELCRSIAKNCEIPIIYNGDVDNYFRGFDEFAGYAVGRYALKNIGVFNGETINPFTVMLKLIELWQENFDEKYTVNQVKKFAPHIFYNMVGGKNLRAAINCASTVESMIEIIKKFDKTKL